MVAEDIFDTNPEELTYKTLKYKMKYITEFYSNILESYHNQEPEKLVDGVMNLMMVLSDLVAEAGINGEQAFMEVQRNSFIEQISGSPKKANHEGNTGNLKQVFEQKEIK